jgi:hypothetical protein
VEREDVEQKNSYWRYIEVVGMRDLGGKKKPTGGEEPRYSSSLTGIFFFLRRTASRESCRLK